jgi:hypothetical protein
MTINVDQPETEKKKTTKVSDTGDNQEMMDTEEHL